mgnify:FL=1
MTGALRCLARHGRWLLVGGLVAGIALPGFARWMVGAIVPLIGLNLFLVALRLGPRAALPPSGALRRVLSSVLALQLLLPLAAAAGLAAAGLLSHPVAYAVVLVLAAAPITGAPGLAIMCGADAGVTLRQTALGTVLLPLTSVPVFVALPLFPDLTAVSGAALRLLALIGGAFALAGLVRRLVPAVTRPDAGPAVDGLIALVMGLMVIGLMSAVGPALRALDPRLFATLAVGFALQLGLAAAGWAVARRRRPAGEAAGFAVVASNRNLAMFLAGLPPETAGAILLFVGCYQIPMYLAPLTLPRLPGWPRGGPG